MKKKYIIGIDGGSQSSKVIIFDLEGNIVAQGKQDLKPMHLAEYGIAEHPDDDLWDSLTAACQQAMNNFSGNKEDIIGVGVCTIRCCRILMKKDGTLAAPAISWMDLRLARPYEHDVADVAYVTTTTGYITHRLSGKTIDTVGNLVGEWPVDFEIWDWSKDSAVFQRFNIPREMLFDVKMPGTIAGYITETAAKLTGIPVGIPVVTTSNDKAVEALGAGLTGEDSVMVSLGTYICGMAEGKNNVTNATHFWTNMASIPNKYLYESSGIRRGMWTVSWFKELLGDEISIRSKQAGISEEEYLEQLARIVPAGSDGLMTVLDWLAPPSERYRKGVFIGFDGRHGRGHIYRSILEAIALTMKGHVESMISELNMEPKRVIISGGGSNSDLFMQIFADCFGLRTERNVINGAAGLGSAICASVAVGAYPDFETAIKKMVRIRDGFDPINVNVQLYQRMFTEVYKDLREDISSILKRSYNIFK